MFFTRKYLAVIVVSFLCGCKEHNSTISDGSIQSIKQSIENDTVKDSIINIPPVNFSYGIPNDSLYFIEFLERKKSIKETKKKKCDKNNFTIYFYKLVDIENASDPVLNVLIVFRSENIIYKTTIATVDTTDATLIEINKDPCYFGIKYYSSPVGYSEYYVYDLIGNIVWKTQKLDELEELAKNAFNMVTKEYSINGNPTPQNLEVVEKF